MVALRLLHNIDIASFDTEAWISDIHALEAALASINSSFLTRLSEHSAMLVSSYDERMLRVRTELLHTRACGPDEDEAIVTAQCLPLVTQFKMAASLFEQTLRETLSAQVCV